MKSYGIPYEEVGKFLLIPYSGLAILSIIIGNILKTKPYLRRILFILSSFLYLLAFIGLYKIPNTKNPSPLHYSIIIIFLAVMSFAFAVYYTCLTSSIPYVVHK